MEKRDDLKYYAKLATKYTFYIAGQIELTSRCFQNCKYCAKDRKIRAYPEPMSLNKLKRIVLELSSRQWFESLTLTGGDPLAWPYLDEFLLWYSTTPMWNKFDLHINTTLSKEPTYELWSCLKSVRISIDGVTPEILKRTRGVGYDIQKIYSRMKKLKEQGVKIFTNTCVGNENITHVSEILDSFSKNEVPIDKAMFLIYLDYHQNQILEELWKRTIAKEKKKSRHFKTSFGENPLMVRQLVQQGVLKNVRCWASKLGFHMKPDGSIYHCCLTGGEAVEADDKHKVYTYKYDGDMDKAYSKVEPTCHYKYDARCQEICQYKQTSLNIICEKASRTKLKLP